MVPPPRVHVAHPLLRVGQLSHYLLRTSPVRDPSYATFCGRLVGHIIDERPLASESGAVVPFRRATVRGWRTRTPLGLAVHAVEYSDGRHEELLQLVACSLQLITCSL